MTSREAPLQRPSPSLTFPFNMADALSELPGHHPADPDAQATITDFIDYTEYYPSDLFRSLTLIGKLDDAFLQHAATVHQLTKTYAALPSLPPADRPDPESLRKDISLALHQALRCRESSYAEAARLSTVTDNLTHRIRTIKRKLQALPKPPSREPTPAPKASSPLAQRNRKLENERGGPRIRLKFEDAKPSHSDQTPRRRHLSRRVVVPGEILPPFDPNSPGIDDFSDSEPEPLPTTSHRARDKTPKLPKIPKADRIKLPKPAHRLPGSSGTNVHSSVAGISVSNAMALLEPPPLNPALGSKHAPWLSLTEWELNKIRKRMKKNADWLPSDIMVQRELAAGGRGATNKARAQAFAAEAGEEFLDEQPDDFKRPVNFKRRASEPVYNADGEELLVSRGMKLNEAKKLKRKRLLEEEAAEREEANRRITEAGLAINDLFSQTDGGLLGEMITLQPSKSSPKRDRKRKRTSGTGEESASRVEVAEENSAESKLPAPKKIKLVPPRAIREDESLSHADKNLTDGDSIVVDPVGAASTTRSARSATSTHTRNSPKGGATPLAAQSQSDQELSRASTSIKLKLNPSKAPSSVTSERRGSLRGLREGKSSTPSAVAVVKKGTADSAIVANGATETMPERRSRRSTADVTPVNEAADTGRKNLKTLKKGRPEGRRSVGSNGRAKSTGTDDPDVDPSEPTYCICGGPSSGRMIACDDAHCKTEWFHLECVGLDPKDVYSRATWFCPDCRSRHGVRGDGIKA